jgi:hypothetical protein
MTSVAQSATAEPGSLRAVESCRCFDGYGFLRRSTLGKLKWYEVVFSPINGQKIRYHLPRHSKRGSYVVDRGDLKPAPPDGIRVLKLDLNGNIADKLWMPPSRPQSKFQR